MHLISQGAKGARIRLPGSCAKVAGLCSDNSKTTALSTRPWGAWPKALERPSRLHCSLSLPPTYTPPSLLFIPAASRVPRVCFCLFLMLCLSLLYIFLAFTQTFVFVSVSLFTFAFLHVFHCLFLFLRNKYGFLWN